MASTCPKITSGKIYDPVFLIMLLAIILAVGASLMLRAAVTCFGSPGSASPQGSSQLDPHMHNISQTDGDH